jgi:YbgC/YbaW family acyl-CoA thioester hydrolase
MPYKRFESSLIVRPDDIDMNDHVHNSKYLDYVLFARYDQMGRCYGMAMDDFFKRGWGWVVKACFVEFKRPLRLADHVLIRTWLDSVDKTDVKVGFQIVRANPEKISAEGYLLNTMVNLETGRAEPIPDWVIRQYTQFTE